MARAASHAGREDTRRRRESDGNLEEDDGTADSGVGQRAEREKFFCLKTLQNGHPSQMKRGTPLWRPPLQICSLLETTGS